MFHQKMICQILDAIINKVNSLICDYSQRTSKLSQPYLWARDQGKGVARVQAKRKPESHITYS
jgi:hypothetical protein